MLYLPPLPALPSPPLPAPGWKSRDSVPKLVEEYLAGQLKVDEFVTHTMPLTDINKAFDLMQRGERYLGVATPTNTHALIAPYSLPFTAFVQLFSFEDELLFLHAQNF